MIFVALSEAAERGELTRAVVRLADRGKGATEIADVLGVCRAVVYECLERAKRSEGTT